MNSVVECNSRAFDTNRRLSVVSGQGADLELTSITTYNWSNSKDLCTTPMKGRMGAGDNLSRHADAGGRTGQ